MGDVIEQAGIGPGDEELDAALEMELAASFLKHPSVSLPPVSVCVCVFFAFPLFQPNPNSSTFSENERCRDRTK